MSQDRTILFQTIDPRGYSVSLSSEQYHNHILSSIEHNAHNEFTPEEIKKCVEAPDTIWESEIAATRDLYFGRTSVTYPKLYLRTVVEVNDEEKTGEVVTAHLTKRISGGKAGGAKYVSYNSKL